MLSSLNRQAQITDRFTRAVDQLGSTELEVRLGGIYALESIARESRQYHGPIVEILTAYVREHAPWPARGNSNPAEKDERTPVAGAAVSTDVQAVMRVLGRRLLASDTEDPLDLRRIALLVVSLEAAHLERANLDDSRLEQALLRGAYLGKAQLARVHLEDADLTGAHLQGAVLRHARLDRAKLEGAQLEDAELNDAHMEKARLGNAYLVRAKLRNATLKGANLWEANLKNADLYRANLVDANLGGADLGGADLSEADLKGANLRGAHNLQATDLSRASYNWATLWPDDYTPPPRDAATFDVIMKDGGDRRIQVINALREWTGSDVKEAKEMLDTAPQPVLRNVTADVAREIETALLRAGATVELARRDP